MRALCGAIITAGALIGLGMTMIGFGTRYQDVPRHVVTDADGNVSGEVQRLKFFREVDRPLQFGIIFLAAAAVIGLGITILGLAYHHERRYRERCRELGIDPFPTAAGTRTGAGP